MSPVGEPARSSLRWTDHGNGFWTATGPTGTHWEIREFGSARYGITVAHWDHPDWWAPNLDAAKALAAEVDARPPIPESEQIDERPVVMPEPGREYDAYTTAERPPAGRCRCGSLLAPHAVKPSRQSPEWWDDPSPYWKCPACGVYRAGIND